MRFNIGFPVVRTDGRAAGGVRSRDYQIFWDGSIYLVLRYKRKMQLYLQKRLRIDACPAVLFQNRDNCFSLLCFLPCLDVHIITFFFSSFLSSFTPFFRLFFFPFPPFEFHGPPDKQSFCGASNKIFSSPARPVPIMLTSCFLLFFFLGGGKGGTLVDFALFLILSTTLARKDYLSLSSRDVIT